MSERRMPVSAIFDERRNTSQVRGPAPDALEKALKHLRASRDEEWYRWVVEVWGKQGR